MAWNFNLNSSTKVLEYLFLNQLTTVSIFNQICIFFFFIKSMWPISCWQFELPNFTISIEL